MLCKSNNFLLKILVFQGAVYGFIPFKFFESSKRFEIVKSKVFYNRLIVLILNISLLYLLFETFETCFHSISNMRNVIAAISLSVSFTLTIVTYNFISLNLQTIVMTLNKIAEFCKKSFSEERSFQIFTAPIIFECFVLGPILFLVDLTFTAFYLAENTEVNYSTLVPILTYYPMRLVVAAVCLCLNYFSLILESHGKTDIDKNLYELLTLLVEICDILESYVSIYIFCHYVVILSYYFGSCTYTITAIMADQEVLFLYIMLYLLNSFAEKFHLWLMINACNNLHKNVS